MSNDKLSKAEAMVMIYKCENKVSSKILRDSSNVIKMVYSYGGSQTEVRLKNT